MSETLLINACVRENSRTLVLTKHVLNIIGANDAEEVKLYEVGLPPLTLEAMKARGAAFEAKDFSESYFDLAKQFANAKTIVIAAPYWDLMFPAVLKSYFENITVNGLVFVYGENGIPKGLCKAQRLIYVTTSGGPIIKNFGFDYACALAKSFYGIKDVRCVSAEGLDIHGADEEMILAKAMDAVKDILA